ncbi:MAG TPA: GDP-L-fucose synthase [Burkholderiales bacterium]|jgi:GDP-L-fucose synthase|nr:GDP-L-fucose synthase [Burkholderiales bacterium]
MQLSDRIYVAGHRGLVGSAILRRLQAAGYRNLLTRSHAELELTEQEAVRGFFERERPDHVVLAAARVGGIVANETHPAEFLRENLEIQDNVIHQAWRTGVKRLLFLGSSCIYPRDCPQPIKEEYLLTGPLEATNRAYAIAKIAGVEMCWSYNRQHGCRYLAAMPTNLYGPGDNYDLNSSHVIPALIRKMHEARSKHVGEVVVWGTGSPKREFLYSEDAADACVYLLAMPEERYRHLCESSSRPPLVNIGSGEDLSIRELAQIVARVVGFQGNLAFDASKPDGTPRKLLDVSRLAGLGWRYKTKFEDGLRLAYADFLTSRYAVATA